MRMSAWPRTLALRDPQCRKLVGRNGFLGGQELCAGIEIGSSHLQDCRRAIERIRDDVTDSDVDLAHRLLSGLEMPRRNPGKKLLRGRRIGALAKQLIHAVPRDHFDGDFGCPLKVIGCSGRDLTGEHERCRRASAHQDGDPIAEIGLDQQEAIFRRALDRVAQRTHAARDDRDLMHGIGARQGRGYQGVAQLVIGDARSLLHGENATLLLQSGDDPLHGIGEVGAGDGITLATRGNDRGLVDQIGKVGEAAILRVGTIGLVSDNLATNSSW